MSKVYVLFVRILGILFVYSCRESFFTPEVFSSLLLGMSYRLHVAAYNGNGLDKALFWDHFL